MPLALAAPPLHLLSSNAVHAHVQFHEKSVPVAQSRNGLHAHALLYIVIYHGSGRWRHACMESSHREGARCARCCTPLNTAGGLCRAAPVELPTAEEFAADAASLDTLRAAVSPVFFSTAADGSVEEGLRHLALKAGKPVLLVGNHQTFPIDLGPLVEGVRALMYAYLCCAPGASDLSPGGLHVGAPHPRQANIHIHCKDIVRQAGICWQPAPRSAAVRLGSLAIDAVCVQAHTIYMHIAQAGETGHA